MNPVRRKRLFIILTIIAVLALITSLVLYALRQNINLFYTPTQVVNAEAPKGVNIRVGGLVENGSFKRAQDSLKSEFTVTDTSNSITVYYEGILPDLFREGQGIVAKGKLLDNQNFLADEVLAKHDENYMSAEVKEALEQQGYWQHQQSNDTKYQ